MILEQITLRSFCLFRGEQSFDLAPLPAPRNAGIRPIILFGGNNGTGKTTLLDAVQLALYGPRARCSKRAGLAYEEFLRRSIHHGVKESEGAGVSLSFRFASQGEEHLYEITRSWSARGGKLREDLRVLRDGLHDRWHSEHWNQLVEDFFPLEVSQLFFFDAEKIRSLAEDETSSQVLGTAVKALLGLDVVERLISDAGVLEASLTTKPDVSAKPQDNRVEIEREIERLRADIDVRKTDRSELENALRRARQEVERFEADFAAAGGRHWEARNERRQRKGELDKEIAACDSQLVTLAGSEMPLALVTDLLARVADQDRREQERAEAEVIERLLSQRDDELLALLAASKAPSSLVKKVEAHLAGDRRLRASSAGEIVPRHSLTAAARSLLRDLRGFRLAEIVRIMEMVRIERRRLENELEDVKKMLGITPEEDAIGQFFTKLRAATERLTTLSGEATRQDRALDEKKREWEAQKAKLHAIKERAAKDEFSRDDRGRMARVAARTKEVMREFLIRATERKIDRLSDLITESFRFLCRKQTMVERIHIDPATFAVTLFGEAGHALSRERLSEGEKQIFAISILWGLARASAHPLPAIIDTPMARLDAAHRRHLVERYFPHASHQVVILSTDTEVDRHYYQALQPHIARAYHLCYDEQTRATHGEEGYFWDETAAGVDTGSQE
ncbi:MAG: DNA sulfur modification protein DndD [Isosphaeraceae bacterium]